LSKKRLFQATDGEKEEIFNLDYEFYRRHMTKNHGIKPEGGGIR
jgi:hypothetical protein